MATVKDRFALLFKSEPERSFIKAGILDSNEQWTQEGKEIFYAWLLKKYGADFKTEVVDKLLAEDKEA